MEREQLLSRKECNALRGIAIICIMLHNYSHWLTGMPSENEYSFKHVNARGFINAISSLSWDLPVQLLSFLGHYGVPVFLFLSAYGLVAKYEQGNSASERISSFRFLKYHYLKLLRLMSIGFAIYMFSDLAVGDFVGYTVSGVIAELCMLSNVAVVLNDSFSPIPMPYWFFGMLFELYCAYSWFMYKRPNWTVVALLVVCIVPQFFFLPASTEEYVWHFNFMGCFLPFALGILVGRYQRRIMAWTKSWGVWTNVFVFVLSFVGIVAFSLEYIPWIFSPVFAITGMIALARLLKGSLLKCVVWLGSISAVIYIIHPTVRQFTIQIGLSHGPYVGLSIYVVITIVAACLLSLLLRYIPKPKL